MKMIHSQNVKFIKCLGAGRNYSGTFLLPNNHKTQFLLQIRGNGRLIVTLYLQAEKYRELIEKYIRFKFRLQ